MKKLKLAGICAVSACLLVSTACASGPQSQPQPSSVEPVVGSAESKAKVKTMPEWLELVADCIRDKGWEVDVDVEENSYGNLSVTGEQIPAFQEDSEDCESQTGRAPNDVPVTKEFASDYFDYLVEMKSCLLGLGYPSSDPPSKESFVETFLQGLPPWSPYSDLPRELDEKVWRDINKSCPESFEGK